MPTLALLVEYDGLKFCGYQSQPNARSVEEELRRALSTILREDVRVIYGSGRTDTGVHAKGQVVSLRVQALPEDLNLVRLGVSGMLKPDLAIREVRVVSDEFHARRNAKSKQYSYRIINRVPPPVLDYGRAWHVSAPLDLQAMRTQAAQLLGEHDFAGFRTGPAVTKSSRRVVFESEVNRCGDFITYRIVGSGFLRHMVRGIVGTLVLHGKGLPCSSVSEILLSGNRELAGPNAPPYGLCLDWVAYSEDPFPLERQERAHGCG